MIIRQLRKIVDGENRTVYGISMPNEIVEYFSADKKKITFYIEFNSGCILLKSGCSIHELKEKALEEYKKKDIEQWKI